MTFLLVSLDTSAKRAPAKHAHPPSKLPNKRLPFYNLLEKPYGKPQLSEAFGDFAPPLRSISAAMSPGRWAVKSRSTPSRAPGVSRRLRH